jgi:hypothetical protein
MKPRVVDASVIAAAFFQEEHGRAARALLLSEVDWRTSLTRPLRRPSASIGGSPRSSWPTNLTG